MLFFLILFLVVVVTLLWLYLDQRRQNIIERLTFGFEEPVEAPPEDLSAGDYGLVGFERFIYHLRSYLESLPGKFLLFGAGALIGGVIGFIGGLTTDRLGVAALAGGCMLWLLAMAIITSYNRKRSRRIQNELPNALEMLSSIMEGGTAFEAALAHVLRESDRRHPLYYDLAIMDEAMQRGRRRSEALRLWAQRCNVAQVQEVSAAMIQAEQIGSSLADVMRHHAMAQLREIEAQVQQRAERLPIRMIFPMLLTIMPAMFIIAAGPSLLKLMRMFEALMRGLN
ncbi:MAG TPA: type II secretion system F family protein [Methylophilaceae bacterium]